MYTFVCEDMFYFMICAYIIYSVSTVKPKHVIVSEEEYEVMDKIEMNLKELDEIQSDLNELNEKLPKSLNRIKQEKLKQTEIAHKKIMDLFDNIDIAVDIAKQKFIKEINGIKENITSMTNDDNKENDIIIECTKKINAGKQFLSGKHGLCNEKIESMGNEERKQRKQEIINIGREMSHKYNETKNALAINCKKIEETIKQNDKSVVRIDFIINETTQQTLYNCIENIGRIKNIQYESKQAMELDTDQNPDNHENIIINPSPAIQPAIMVNLDSILVVVIKSIMFNAKTKRVSLRFRISEKTEIIPDIDNVRDHLQIHVFCINDEVDEQVIHEEIVNFSDCQGMFSVFINTINVIIKVN